MTSCLYSPLGSLYLLSSPVLCVGLVTCSCECTCLCFVSSRHILGSNLPLRNPVLTDERPVSGFLFLLGVVRTEPRVSKKRVLRRLTLEFHNALLRRGEGRV